MPQPAVTRRAPGRALGHPLWAIRVSLAASLPAILPVLALLGTPAVRHAAQGPWRMGVGAADSAQRCLRTWPHISSPFSATRPSQKA